MSPATVHAFPNLVDAAAERLAKQRQAALVASLQALLDAEYEVAVADAQLAQAQKQRLVVGRIKRDATAKVASMLAIGEAVTIKTAADECATILRGKDGVTIQRSTILRTEPQS